MLLGGKLCQLMEYLRPKIGNPLAFLVLFILLILCLPNISNKNCHDTGENKFSAEHIGGLVIITLCHLMEQLRPKIGNPLAILVLFILLILCLPNISNKFYHGTGGDQLSAQQKKEGLVSVPWESIASDHGADMA